MVRVESETKDARRSDGRLDKTKSGKGRVTSQIVVSHLLHCFSHKRMMVQNPCFVVYIKRYDGNLQISNKGKVRERRLILKLLAYI